MSPKCPFPKVSRGITGFGQNFGDRYFVATQTSHFVWHADHTHAVSYRVSSGQERDTG